MANTGHTGIQQALITGGSRGIGFHIAQKLVENGIDVCIVGRDGDRLKWSQQNLRQIPNSGKVYTIRMDLEDPDTPERLIRDAVEQLGGLDLLVNNAGICLTRPFEKTSVQQWDKTMQINARAPYFLCQNALPWLRESDAPTIIQIASVVGYSGYEEQSVYAASKHALLGFTKALSKEVQHEDIRVYTISPGGVATEMIGSARPDLDKGDLIDPEEISELVWYILTHRGTAMIDHFMLRRPAKTAWS